MIKLMHQNIGMGLLLSFMAAFFVVTNSDSTSPLFSTRTLDSSIFQYMGYAITQGKVPYTDFFDHKGLLLYLFNAIGVLISKRYGVLLLQIIYLTLVLGVWYKGLVMVRSVAMRLCIIAISLLSLYHCYSCGNLTEDWSILFISIPLMLYFRKLGGDGVRHFNNLELLSIGLCIGCIMMIRLNNFFPMMGVPLFCAFIALKDREYAYLLRAFLLVTAGCIVPLLACVFIMYIIGGMQGVDNMIFANLTFNLSYNEDHTVPYDMEFVKFIYKVLLPLPFLLFFSYKRSIYTLPLIIGYLLTILTIGKVHFFHYLIVFLPLIAYGIGIVQGKWRIALMGVILLFNVKTFYNQFSIDHFQLHKEDTTEKFAGLMSAIPLEDRDKVWSYNGAFILKEYIGCDLIPCNRLFLPWQTKISEELRQSEENKICRVRPKYVIYPVYVEDWMNKSAIYSGSEKDERFIKENYDTISSITFDDGIKVCLLKTIR